MNNFEATILISPDITKDNLNKVVEMIEKLVVKEGGKVIGKEEWGLRDLAYKMYKEEVRFCEKHPAGWCKTENKEKFPELSDEEKQAIVVKVETALDISIDQITMADVTLDNGKKIMAGM